MRTRRTAPHRAAPAARLHFSSTTQLWCLLLFAAYPPTVWAGDGDFGPLIIGAFFSLLGLIAGAIGTFFLPAKKLVKALALIPMAMVGCATGFGLSIVAMEMLKTPAQKAEKELQNGLPGLVKFSCNGDDLALTQYLQKMSAMMQGQGERIEKALECTHNHPWGIKGVDSAEPKTLQLKASTFVILSQELYRVSPGATNYYCTFLKHLHEQHATPLLRALHDAKLPIACSDPAEIPWAHGLKAWDSWQSEPKVREEIWAWIVFLKEVGIDFKQAPANIPTLLIRVVGSGDPRLIRFALEAGSDPLGFSGDKWPSGTFPNAVEVWKIRRNGLSSDNPGGYSPLTGYTSAENIADMAYIDSKIIDVTK